MGALKAENQSQNLQNASEYILQKHRGIQFVCNGLQNIETPVLSCRSCSVIPIGRVRLACIANDRWHERLRRRAYCVSVLSAWGPHHFSVTRSSQSISFLLSNGLIIENSDYSCMRSELSLPMTFLQYNHIVPGNWFSTDLMCRVIQSMAGSISSLGSDSRSIQKTDYLLSDDTCSRSLWPLCTAVK